MKNLLLAAACLFFMAGCKKLYTCECSTTSVLNINNKYITSVNPGNSTGYSQKMTKKQAQAACDHEQTALQSDFVNGVTNSGQKPLDNGESVVTTCTLK